MLRVWQWSRGGFGGPGHLPESGGVLDQPVLMMDALAVMDAAYAKMRKRKSDG